MTYIILKIFSSINKIVLKMYYAYHWIKYFVAKIEWNLENSNSVCLIWLTLVTLLFMNGRTRWKCTSGPKFAEFLIISIVYVMFGHNLPLIINLFYYFKTEIVQLLFAFLIHYCLNLWVTTLGQRSFFYLFV